MSIGTGIFLGLSILTIAVIYSFRIYLKNRRRDQVRRLGEDAISNLDDLVVTIEPLISHSTSHWGTRFWLTAEKINELLLISRYRTSLIIPSEDVYREFGYLTLPTCDPGSKYRSPYYTILDDRTRDYFTTLCHFDRDTIVIWIPEESCVMVIIPFGTVDREMIEEYGITFDIEDQKFKIIPRFITVEEGKPVSAAL